MPEKPKRRKNNKNKRKNKNSNRPDLNKNNNSDLIESDVLDSCSVHSELVDSSENADLRMENSHENVSSLNILTEEKESVAIQTQNLNQDLNNNSAAGGSSNGLSPTVNQNIDVLQTVNYIVESPDQSLKTKTKLSTKIKSKSLDNDEEPKIEEIVDESCSEDIDDNTLAVIDSNVLVSDVESDVEWEKTEEAPDSNVKELVTGTLSITSIPLNFAQCEQTKSLTPDEEISLRHYLETLNLSTKSNVSAVEIKTEIEQIINQEIRHRLRKKGLAEDFNVTRLAPPRILDVIDEESGESSLTSRRQSYLSDKKSDNDDLEDDVFIAPKTKPPIAAKPAFIKNLKPLTRLIPQECVLVGAKIKDQEIAEARGEWSVETVEKMKGAEVVYLTDSSSSTSSIHEIEGDKDKDVEGSDLSVRIVTPTIEVTDADSLLKESFFSDSKDDFKTVNSKIEKLTANLIIGSEDQNQEKIQVGEKMNENVNPHEIVVSSIDNIKTDLYVKDIEQRKQSQNNITNHTGISTVTPKINDENDQEMKLIKSELNNAINNLIKEVSSDSENNENTQEKFARQDSSSSIGSSQCTAKYNPTYSSLNDVSNIMHDDVCDIPKLTPSRPEESNVTSHVKEVFERVSGSTAKNISRLDSKTKQPLPLRDICVQRISDLPYGEKILEELASVSERLQTINTHRFKTITSSKEEYKAENMPYFPLPDLSIIEKVSLPAKAKDSQPPPLKPRNSSLKKSQDDNHWTGVPTKTEPVYICLSPSQKMLMEKTNTIITKEDASQLVDMHKKYVDRRGYNEPNKVHYDIEKAIEPPFIPFKSQTGSRLLALIRDPSITNINQASGDHYYGSDKNKNNYSDTETTFKNRMEEKRTLADFTNSFKPIPPPRPKKYSSSFYESDESSDFTDNSLRSFKSERKYFHYSTGNLSKDIENDISSIQNMHRYYNKISASNIDPAKPRRPSLPKDICDQQMEYIRKKEKEVEAEIRRLELEKVSASSAPNRGPKAPLISEKEVVTEKVTDNSAYYARSKNISMSTQPSVKVSNSKMSSLFSSSQEELLRDKMYSEYVSQMAERQERKQHKIIKITNPSASTSGKSVSRSMPAIDTLDSKVNNRIEKEFICKARERWNKLGITDPETEDEREKDVYREPKVIEHKIKVIDGGEEKDVKKLPTHIQEFVNFTAKQKEQTSASSAVWRPGAPSPPAPAPAPVPRSSGAPPPPPPPVWTPSSAGPSPQAQKKSFKPVHFEETPPARRKFGNFDQNGCTSGSESEGRLRTSHSAPVTGLNSLGSANSTSRLPKAQNPTVTLLQKAREGQIPRVSTSYLQDRENTRLPRDRPTPPPGDPVHALRREYASESEAERSDYERGPRKMADAHRKVEGIGPTTRDGMPVALRSEVKDPSRWYKKMYDTIHKSKYDDDYVTIRYKNRRGQQPQRVTNKSQYAYFDPRSGYLSEPEGGLSRLGSSTWSDAYDSDVTSGPRRRTASVQEERRISDISSPYLPSNKYSTLASARASQEVYKNQPGRIENYVPGKSSVVDKEAKQWWDEVMDIFDGWLDDNSPLPPYTTLLARAIQKSQNLSSTTSLPQASPKEKKDITATILSKSNMARALKESGYESDSTLVFRRRDDTDAPLSPAERRAAYRDLQAGGEPPLRGFRSPAPPRQDESEIEYIPISSTLTKIRVHKKTPKLHEVICYPVTNIKHDVKLDKRQSSPAAGVIPSAIYVNPPAPPRRISSKNSRTLKLVTSTKAVLPKQSQSQSNVNFLKDKISNKLTRQNTHIISKKDSIIQADKKLMKPRIMSTSAPPAIDRKNNINVPANYVKKSATTDLKSPGTSSFGSPRRTLLPTEYSNVAQNKGGVCQSSVVIEGGAGRKTPITNILDKVTSLDKLWSSEKRNERIDISKVKTKSIKANTITTPKIVSSQNTINAKTPIPSVTHKSRDMIRTAEKLHKLKISNMHTKSNPCLSTKSEPKLSKPSVLQKTSMSKSASNIASTSKKQSQVKTAVVTNLKTKKSLENIVIRPRSVPCHEACSIKKTKDPKIIKKGIKPKPNKKTSSKSPVGSETESQFGDNVSTETMNFGSVEIMDKNYITARDIKEKRDAVLSDSFFQHLFLGKSFMPTATYTMLESNKSVLQKAKLFQSCPQDYKESKSLNTYLIHRKPVSLSRFKMWDRFPSPGRSQSPRSISWPGRMHGEIRKFDSLSKSEDFGSTSSLATTRSRSEPPINKIYFTQTSRPKSPTIVFYKKDKIKQSPERSSMSPSRFYFSQTSRSVSPKITHKSKILVPQTISRSHSPAKMVFSETVRPVSPIVSKRLTKSVTIEELEKQPTTLFFSQTSRPVSPKVSKKSHSRSQSTSPVTIRSPSYRRINTVRQLSNRHVSDTAAPLRSVMRTRSAGDADKKLIEKKVPLKMKSDSNLYNSDPDYEEYVKDLQNTNIRSERFRELNRYYAYLERVAELEKTTSNSDIRHRKKDEEIIDFDRWKKIRAIERAEEELNNLYRKLKIAQNENDILFYPRDLKEFRWNFDRDWGLRVKEKSVEDLKEHFQQIPYYDQVEFIDQAPSKDTYKPLWRGTSVAETAFKINKKNEVDKSEQSFTLKPTVAFHQDTSLSELRKKIGLGNRLWSSLSMEQVNALKNQLNAIYSKELESKSCKELDKYSIDVKDSNKTEKPNLHVRCNSLITPQHVNEEEEVSTKLMKSESIAAISCPVTSVKELKNNVNKIQMTLSENEKRKISQTLSKEILDRINKFDNTVPMSLKDELKTASTDNKFELEIKDMPLSPPKQSFNENKLADQSLDVMTKDSKKRHIIYSNEKPEVHSQSSASETDTASSDVSNKTVIYRPSKEVKKKVEYFESVKSASEQSNIIYHARENSDEKLSYDKIIPVTSEALEKYENDSQRKCISQSQSCTNFKELFGECERNKFLSLPANPEIYSRSQSSHSEVQVIDNERRTPDTLQCSSEETVWRSRSPSPDPERYWRAYLNLARAGEVRRLARRFDSPSAAGAVLRRHRSDPEIARNVLHKNWSSFEKFSTRRDRTGLPVAKVPLRSANRYMPHIDIISKLAALRRRTTPRSRSAEEASECRVGEVDRIRRRFEAMSLLGQIYASAPDMSELRDIAPYLAGPWTAHRFPNKNDNNRSIEAPNTLVRGRSSPVKKEIKRPITKDSVKLSSILKSDIFAKQDYDPSVHRPASRYEPPRAPPRPPPAAWPYRLAPYVTPSRHMVTFQESDSAPEPPRRTPYGSYSDTESPRRYLESDVNIHYRCPVRQDPLPLVPERELARQQAEHMKKLYREQRRNKYLQELQDMQNRRHQDNFTPSQKNILPLNRYDEADRIVARALYPFNGQTSRELSFRKGDLINIRRQIDSNWYEGEIHGRIGLFPYNYVEIMKGEVAHTPKKPVVTEGRARAKFDFTAQTNLELPLKKGEVVVLTRRIDQNWWEGRNGTKTGIFPDSYVTILQEPSQNKPEPQQILNTEKPVASPAAHGLLNGTAKRSMGAHSYMPQPNNPALSNAPPATQPLPGYVAKPAQSTLTPSERGYGPPSGPGVDLNNSEPLYVDTNAEAVPYRAMYKYRPQNPDELELQEGDTVYVLEKCDDGWYVGSSQRTGRFGTFPGNYVERI